MTVRPILFSAPMVRALLDGSKTQTRRVLKPQLVCESHARWPATPDTRPTIDESGLYCGVCGAGVELAHHRKSGVKAIPVRFAVGDVLWVRETWCEGPVGRDGVVEDWRDYFYRATDTEIEGVDDGDGYAELNADGSIKSCWKPSIHMPRKASRLTLEVTGVKVERLQGISEADAIAEGVTKVRDHCYVIRGFDYDQAGLCHSSAVTPYAKLWDHINGADAWEANPWVVAVTFAVHQQNVDAFLASKAVSA